MRLGRAEEQDLANAILDAEQTARQAVEGTPVAAMLDAGRTRRERTRGKEVARLGEAVASLRTRSKTEKELRHASTVAAAAWARSQQLRWRLAMSAIGVARAEARRAAGSALSFDDMLQEATVGLLEAARRYEPGTDASFGTYARWWVRAALTRATRRDSMVRLPGSALKAMARLREVMAREGMDDVGLAAERLGIDTRRARHVMMLSQPTSMSEPLAREPGLTHGDLLEDDTVRNPEDQLVEKNRWGLTSEAMDRVLDDRSKEVLVRRYGLHGADTETLRAIAEDFGVTPQRVRQIQKRAEGQIADYARAHA